MHEVKKLSNSDIVKLIKEPKNKALINEAIDDENWIGMFSTSEGIGDLRKHYSSLFVPEMASTIHQYFDVHTLPMLSPVTGTIYGHYKKVCETSDGQKYDPKFSDDTELVNFLSSTDSWDFFFGRYIDLALYHPNTRMILERPSTDDMDAKPYVALAPITSIHDISEGYNGVEYLIIRDGNEYYFYDSFRYAKFRKQKSGGAIIFVSEHEHDFKVTPVRSVVTANKYTTSCIIKKSCISDSINDLYAWNLVKNMSKMYRWQNGLPLHFGISSACKERHETGVQCNNGFFRIAHKDGEITTVRCGACVRKAQSKMTFGKQIDIDYQDLIRSPEIANTLKSAFGYVPSDTRLLEFNEEDLGRWLRQIEANIVGKPFNAHQSRDAKNEHQVEVETDNQRQTLAVFASEMEKAFKWHDSILAYAQYESFQSLDVFLGRGFFVTDEIREIQALRELRLNSGDAFLIADKLKDYASATFQYSQDSKYLHGLFLACIPFIDLPTENIVNNIDAFLTISRKDTIIRLNAVNWISEFMATQKDRLMTSRRDSVKIATIKKFFNDKYTKEYETEFSTINRDIEGGDSGESSVERG